MKIIVDCSFDSKFWPISRELYPYFFQKLGRFSPFQIALKTFSKISSSLSVKIDKRIFFMAERQAKEVGVPIEEDIEFPALVVKPILVEEIEEKILEDLREDEGVVMNKNGEIIAFYSTSFEIPKSGYFLSVDARTVKLDDLPGVVNGKGKVDTEYYKVISDADNVKVVVSDDVVVVTAKEDLTEIFKKHAEGEIRKVHKTAYRPWGSYTVLEDKPNHKVKRITVLPKKRLSLQLHRRRSERWTVIKGIARVTLGDRVTDLSVGESVFIPVETPHRLENPSENEIVEVIEVQVGDYFGEDDIIRLQDDFGRGNEV